MREGRKNDGRVGGGLMKLRYDLVPPHPLRELAKVYTIGAVKYADHNWLGGMAWSRIIAALYRHLEAWRDGRVVDPDDGQHPLASVVWCAFALMEYERLGLGQDDRQITILSQWATEDDRVLPPSFEEGPRAKD